MPRSMWSGSISFGLVTVPVKLYTSVRKHDIRFTQLHGETGARVRQRRVDERTGEEVAYEDVTKGYEIADGRYLVVDPDELEALAPTSSRTIELLDFVAIEDIDPIFFDRPYYLAPANDAARKPYRLLTEAMERSGRAGVARFVMRSKEYLAVLRPRDGALVANTVHYADEIVEPRAIEGMDELGEVELQERELEMAERLIASLETDWEPERYEDQYHERLQGFLEEKAAGREITLEEPAEEPGEVVDLMAALERSLSQAGADRKPTDTDQTPAYAGMSKAQLYDLAQEREIPGRSSMTKDELIGALREADGLPAEQRRAS